MSYTFDGINKEIILTSPGGTASPSVINLDVVDMYSRWKEWLVLTDNSKYREAFFTVGGEPIGGGQSISSYIFLTNDWKIKPPEEDCVINSVGGNLATDDASNPFLPTTGNFTVQVSYFNSSNSISQNGGSSQQDIRDAMLLAPTNGNTNNIGSLEDLLTQAVQNALLAAQLSA
jgi:hypothetical protein